MSESVAALCEEWQSGLVQQYSNCHKGLTWLGILVTAVGSTVLLGLGLVVVLVLVLYLRRKCCFAGRAGHLDDPQKKPQVSLSLSQTELLGLRDQGITPELFMSLHQVSSACDTSDAADLQRTVRNVRNNSGKRKLPWYHHVYRNKEQGKLGFKPWRVTLNGRPVFSTQEFTIKVINKESREPLRLVMNTYDPTMQSRVKVIFLPQEIVIRPRQQMEIEMDVMPIEPQDSRMLIIITPYLVDGTQLTPYYLPFQCHATPLLTDRYQSYSWAQLAQPSAQIVGRGAAGDVYRMRLPGEERMVAVKRFNAISLDPGEVREFCQEAHILSRLNHPCVVQLLGICAELDAETRQPRLALVMEYISYGSLDHLLHPADPHQVRIELSWQLRVKMALDAVRALGFMHRLGVLHRDIKTANLLVASLSLSDPVNIKVADFSIGKDTMDKMAPSKPRHSVISPGTDHYKAVEVLRGEICTRESDVWSMGVVLWELATRTVPYTLAPLAIKSFAIHDAVCGGARLPDLQECFHPPLSYNAIVQSCMVDAQANRPTMEYLAARLRDLEVHEGWRVCEPSQQEEFDEEDGEDEHFDVDQVL